MEKWPYQTAAWKRWLADRRAGKNPPLVSSFEDRTAACEAGSRGDADATIAACTKLIYETPLGASQAAAYIARRLAYETEKDYDRVIADYSEAIQLGNKSALMYDTAGELIFMPARLLKRSLTSTRRAN